MKAVRNPWGDDAEFLRLLLKGAPGVIIVLDRRGRVQYINRLDPGMRVTDFIGKTLYKVVHPRNREEFKRVFACALRGKIATVTAASAGDGEDWWENTMGPLRRNGRVVAVISMAHRIGEKVRLERAEGDLRRLRERFEKMFYHSSDGMTITMGDGTLLDVNPAFCRLVGYSRSELIHKKKFLEITAPEYRKANRSVMRRMIETGEPVKFEKAYIRKDGSRIAVSVTAFALKNEEGRADSYSAIVRDITETKRAEEQIREAAELEQSRLGRDLHDGVGQYMTGISLLARSLQAGLAAKGLREEARRAGQITVAANAAVAQTRALAQGLIPTELGGGLKGALQELARNSKALFGASVRISCPDKLAVEDQKKALNIYRIAQEAVHNACRHGRARNVWINILLGKKTGMGLKISDDGLGLPRRLKPGMGLRTMTHRAASLGGNLEVLARPGRGVTVVCSCAVHP